MQHLGRRLILGCGVNLACLRALQENLQEWLMDPRGRDQFVVRHGDETEVRSTSCHLNSDFLSSEL